MDRRQSMDRTMANRETANRETADWDGVAERLAPAGMILRGGFAPVPDDGLDPAVRTVLLVGNAGPALWRAFAAARSDDAGRVHPDPDDPDPDDPDPMDRWTRDILEPVAAAVGARAVYPFGGPPWHPFQRWAQRAESVFVSPLGLLAHPAFGLWHAWRGALLFDRPLALPPAAHDHPNHPGPTQPGPCETCADQPCLTGCPVGAFSAAGYDVSACTAHIRSSDGGDCVARGCRARRACPVGAAWHYDDDQARFHMTAFERRRPRA